nr:hypothetical protein [Tanacetum cinerariifolium]
MGSKEEGERIKRKGLRLEHDSAKKVKTSEEVSKEGLKRMMQLVPVREVYVEALQHFDREDLNQLWTLVKETLSIKHATGISTAIDEFPLPEDFPTASKKRFPLLRIQQLLQNEHYALWEVIEFGDSYEAPQEVADTVSASEGSTKKKGRTVTVTTEDIQKRRNDVKVRTTILLALPDEHQLRFSKYKTAKELWDAILKTFGGNEATKKSKKNQLKQQYGNFKAERNETLEQTFNRLQAIVSHMEFMDVEIEQDDLNQKLLTSLAPEWLMHTIVWRNRSDLDTMSLDDLYNHLKVYEPEVQKKSDSQNMAFISSAKNNSGKEEIDEDDINEMDIKWNMALLSIRAKRFWKKTGKKISIQGTDVASFNKSKVECFNCHKMGHFARECRAPRSQDRGRRENFKHGSKVEESAPKALMAIDGVGWDLNYMANEEEDHALVTKQEALTEFVLMAKSSSDTEIRGLEFKVESKDNRTERLTNELEELKKEKEGLYSKLIGFKSTSKDLDTLLGSQRSNKNNEGIGYSAVPPPAQVYSPPKKDMSWTRLPEFADDTFTDYSRPSFTDSPTVIKTNKDETVRKPSVKYAEMPIQKKLAVRTQFRVPRVSTGNTKFPTVNKNFPTGNSKLSTADLGNKGKAVNTSACWIWKPRQNSNDKGNSQNNIDDKGYWDSGCSRHMTGNISYLSNYEPFDGGYVSFGQGGCKITGKGTIKTDFKLRDDTNVLLRTPRQHNIYSIDLNNIVPYKDLTCLVAKAFANEIELWHMRLGHLNFKTMNKLVRHNLVRDLPSKCFENNHTCVACLKGKQHKAFCKTKLVHSVTKPLYTLHMDLFGPTSVTSLNHKWYCLVVTDDFSRFTWTFFLKTKDETSGILRNFITEIENQKELKNGVAKRRNRTLIEAAKTMLADAKLPVTFWAEAVNTTCYVQNRVLVNKSQNKTPYELFNGRTPAIGFLKPFGCHVMILNTLDHLGKFKAKGDEGTTSTNFSGTKDAASQDVKKDVSSLRYIILPNWFHEAHLESSTSNAQDACDADTPESSGNSNPTATSTNPRLIIWDTNRAEADLSNMENNISASPTPTFRIHKDYPTSQIISSVDTPVQTRNKSKEMEEQSFIALIYHMTNPDLLQGKGKVYTASVLTASTQVSTASTNVAATSLSHDTICAYIASQSNGSHFKYEYITQIDKDDIEEMDIKWNMALLSMRADRFWKKTGHFARECRAPRSQDRGKRESYKQASPGNTSPDPLNDLTKDLLASLAFSSFHDDPYMKVMQAYDVNNNELHIPPQAP